MRNAIIGVATALLLSACVTAPQPARAPAWSIAVHGGAGVIERNELTPEQDAAHRASLDRALAQGERMLAAGASALDVVEAVTRVLEDDPLFNAGRGAVFTAEGRIELDASIMDGRTRAAGAAAGLTRTKNPISLARAVMEKSPHVMLTGEGAETFARLQGLEEAPPGWFFTERRWQALERTLRERGLPMPQRPEGAPPSSGASWRGPDERKFGTVGVVVRDRAGHFAAGTSTGGTTAKRWGRVGDAPIIGAGTYAADGVCAVSATGAGEYFIRAGVARTICARIELAGESAQAAADHVIQRELVAMGGDGGVIVIGPTGEPVFSINTSGMYRARATAGGLREIAIYADE